MHCPAISHGFFGVEQFGQRLPHALPGEVAEPLGSAPHFGERDGGQHPYHNPSRGDRRRRATVHRPRPLDDDGDHRTADVGCQPECPSVKRLQFAARRALALREPQHRHTALQPTSTTCHRPLDARSIAGLDANIAVHAHVPADERNTKVPPLADPFERQGESGQGEDVGRGLVVGDQHAGGVRGDVLAPLHLDLAAGQTAQVELCPPAGITVQQRPRRVEWRGQPPDQQGSGKKKEGDSGCEGPVAGGEEDGHWDARALSGWGDPMSRLAGRRSAATSPEDG